MSISYPKFRLEIEGRYFTVNAASAYAAARSKLEHEYTNQDECVIAVFEQLEKIAIKAPHVLQAYCQYQNGCLRFYNYTKELGCEKFTVAEYIPNANVSAIRMNYCTSREINAEIRGGDILINTANEVAANPVFYLMHEISHWLADVVPHAESAFWQNIFRDELDFSKPDNDLRLSVDRIGANYKDTLYVKLSESFGDVGVYYFLDRDFDKTQLSNTYFSNLVEYHLAVMTDSSLSRRDIEDKLELLRLYSNSSRESREKAGTVLGKYYAEAARSFTIPPNLDSAQAEQLRGAHYTALYTIYDQAAKDVISRIEREFKNDRSFGTFAASLSKAASRLNFI